MSLDEKVRFIFFKIKQELERGTTIEQSFMLSATDSNVKNATSFW